MSSVAAVDESGSTGHIKVETYSSPVPYRVIGAVALLVALVAAAIFVIAFVPPAAAFIIPAVIPLLAAKIVSGVVAVFSAALGIGLLAAAPKNEEDSEAEKVEDEVADLLQHPEEFIFVKEQEMKEKIPSDDDSE